MPPKKTAAEIVSTKPVATTEKKSNNVTKYDPLKDTNDNDGRANDSNKFAKSVMIQKKGKKA